MPLTKRLKQRVQPTPEAECEISFNFRRLRVLKESEDKFDYTRCDAQYFVKLLERLSAISGMTWQQLRFTRSDALRFHIIDFEDDRISEDSFGFDLDVAAYPCQFSVSSNEHGRVHGYFVGNVFHIVWLDPKHELYP